MGEIYTSYYAKAGHLNPDEYVFLQISNSVPKFWNLPIQKIPELVPSWSLVDAYKKGNVTEEEYTIRYTKQLSDLDKSSKKINNVAELLERLSKDKNVVLLCYEKSDNFCHRNIAAPYLNKEYGLNITELGKEQKKENIQEEPSKDTYEQLSFFDMGLE